ncbi:MAG: hypothetical protein KAJ21_02010 [Thermoplasmatales archaeon]|nr:hypothetical protein [Thermoplasmatales archaeon]
MNIKFSISIICLILIFNSLSINNIKGISNDKIIEETINFSNPELNYYRNKLNISIKETNHQYIYPNQPILPIYIKNYKFPIGTKIKNITFQFSDIKKIIIHNNSFNYINPEQDFNRLYNIFRLLENKINTKINNYYIDDWYLYRTGTGLDGDKRVLFLTIGIFPVKNSPIDNQVEYFNKCKLRIEYEEPKFIVDFDNSFDMLIISTDEFSNNLTRYIEHKNSSIKVLLKTINEIPDIGRDIQENIKLYIKNAIEDYGITHVLIIGDNDDIPGRLVNVRDIRSFIMDEKSFISDLYFADIYNETGGFSSWDSNDNNIFGEYRLFDIKPADNIDLYPDVYFGRLPCRNENELSISIDKIISYEANESYNQNWFSNIVVIGGDTFTEDLVGISEGEYITNSIINEINYDNYDKIWGSNGRLKNAKNISLAIENGAGFVAFEGHAGSNSYRTHPEKTRNEWIPIEWYRSYHINGLNNKNMLPIVTINGCNTCKFSVDHSCFGWSFIINPNGGGIATIGMTSLSWIYPGIFSTEGLGGLIHISFYKSYNRNESQTFGELWGNSIIEYLNLHPGEISRYDYKTIESWQPLGDPSLIIS